MARSVGAVLSETGANSKNAEKVKPRLIPDVKPEHIFESEADAIKADIKAGIKIRVKNKAGKYINTITF
jgi:hypothetical protein